MKVCIWLMLVSSSFSFSEMIIPARIQIQPMFFVPIDQAPPTSEQQLKLTRHILTSQKNYQRMLKNRDTFRISDRKPLICRGRFALDYYKTQDQKSLSILPVEEVFERFGYSRFNCPYLYVIIVMNASENIPAGGGRPFNRGFNNGGGFVYVSSYALDKSPGFQSTLLHELGHSFGLVHAASYGYDMNTNLSVMSYNQENLWDGYRVTKRAGTLIPEDLRALNFNKRVFPNFTFNAETDVPQNYKLHPVVVRLALVEEFPNQRPFEVAIQSDAPNLADTKPQNIVHGVIWPLTLGRSDQGIKGLASNAMWMTELSPFAWGKMDVQFPVEIKLSKVTLYFDCGNLGYMPSKVNIGPADKSASMPWIDRGVSSPEMELSFEPQTIEGIRVQFQAGTSGRIVLRGIRFYTDTGEVFCPDFPF
ncbi:MAG: hypothetical protein LLF76_08190 [Planctomycetaceae bacterium]|nr:hypothetical protein [Planctomycetaceae bacterium]